MEQFYQYLENKLPDKHNDKIMYKFKMKTLEDMTNRANELTSRGLKDNAVISDLIISEYGDLEENYAEYRSEKLLAQKRKSFLIGNIIGSVAYLFLLVIVFLGIGFTTHKWHPGWVIVADGVLVWVAYLLTLGVNRIVEMKRIFHIFARLLLAMDIVVLSVAMFLFMMAVMNVPNSWVIVFGGLFAMFFADASFATITKRRLAIFNWLIYMPAMSAMLFIIIGALGLLPWNVAWVMIPLSLVIDVIIIIAKIRENTNYKEEVVDTWQEN